MKNEKELLSHSVREPRVVIHFAKKEFRRCAILDRHLEHLARQHPDTLFLKTYVESAPFLVEKLELRVLPCLMAFVHGVCKDKLIGFQDFGNSDAFSTAALEWRLGQTGTLATYSHNRRACAAADATEARAWFRRAKGLS